MLVKNRVVDKDRIARVPLIQALRSWPLGSCVLDSGPPASA
jgi:hypothetical protein